MLQRRARWSVLLCFLAVFQAALADESPYAAGVKVASLDPATLTRRAAFPFPGEDVRILASRGNMLCLGQGDDLVVLSLQDGRVRYKCTTANPPSKALAILPDDRLAFWHAGTIVVTSAL